MNTYDPAKVVAMECPVYRRALAVDFNRFFYKKSMKDLCIALCGVPDSSAFDFTHEEWQAIADVANGGMWPIPDHPYTEEDWSRDIEFAAAPGQEITEEIYEDRYDVLPIISLPRCQRTEGYTAGFMVSEPLCSDPETGKLMYGAYGKKDGKYYFIGILPRRPAD